MPRNAAKKTNKNTKGLPVLVTLTTNKTKRRNINNNNKNRNKKKRNTSNNNSTTTNSNHRKEHQKQQKKSKKADFRVNPTNDNCDANTNLPTILRRNLKFTINSQFLKISPTPLISNTTSIPHTSAETVVEAGHQQENVGISAAEPQNNTILKYFKNLTNSEQVSQPSTLSSSELTNPNGKEQFESIESNLQSSQSVNTNFNGNKCCIVSNNGKNEYVFNTERNITPTKAAAAEAATTEAVSTSTSSPLSTAGAEAASSSSTSTSTSSRLSTLYPIVIETHISETQSLPGDLNTATTRTTTSSATRIAAAASTTKHSTSFNVQSCTAAATATAAETETSNTTATTAAVDTLLKHQKQQQQQKSQNKALLTQKHHHQQQQQQQQQQQHQQQQQRQRKRRHYHHPHEVKARLATLRTRKVIVADNDNKPAQQQKGHKNLTEKKEEEEKKNASEKLLAKNIAKKQGDNVKLFPQQQQNNEGYFKKRVFSQFDEATLNRIETLSDNEVKKPTNKRKRNQAAALLGFNIHPARSRRVAATAQAAVIVAAGATVDRITGSISAGAAGAFGGEQRQLGVDFLKPLPIEAANTNSKKRPRIMSLYERPYQTANDGRGGSGGSVVSNGYMSTSRSSSSGGGSGVAMVMSDSNDSQDMANQYYLSGTSGSVIAGNSNSSALLGNGSAIIHAPTMGTLCNIGNTCYLNSVVYTLRFAPQFLHNLHHLLADLNALQQNIARARAKSSSLGRGISAVHMENARSWSSKDLASMEQYANTAVAVGGIPSATSSVIPATTTSASSALTQVTQKSSHQVLTEKLHELYQSLYCNEMSESTEPHHADTLLHAIQDVSTIFEGNQQQDAHEFLMCVLNSIRETSQTLIKAIAECPDVILNGYISNPDDTERDIKLSNIGGGGGGNGSAGGSNNSNNSNMSAVSSALSSITSNSKSSSFFSRISKRKDETKNSKNSRLQSPLKDNQIAGNTNTPQSNSLFYLNTNDLNSSASTSPPSAAGGATSVSSPSNSSSAAHLGAGDEVADATSSSLALLLKDKQRLEGKIRALGLDFFNEDFEGITVSTTKCLSCETVTEQKETMIDIAVPVPQAGYKVKEDDTDNSFIQNSCITREFFRNENKYRCEQCCGYTEAIRSISYEVLPRLLIIQLSRFSGGMEKINSYIPTSFTLQCFCSKCCELSDANKLHIYKLYSVITHVGATMSVGHYIAYTCSLDWANEYINCPKEQRRRASQERAAAAGANGGGGGNGSTLSGQTQAGNSSQSSSSNALSLGSSSSTTSFMKIMKFGRNKASSSGDMSKNVKHLNGLTTSSKAITNGIGKLTMNNSSSGAATSSASSSATQCSTTCPSINCCAMRLTAQQQLHYLHNNQTNVSEYSEDSAAYLNGGGSGSGYVATNYNNNMHQPYTTSSNNTSGYGSTGRGATKASYASQIHNGTEPIWYMCDDDKIKAMTQREFEELLSPARKITITPYLLFYARYNLQTSSPPKSATSSSSPGPVTSSPQASWSNESLQSSGHSAHSSGMRM